MKRIIITGSNRGIGLEFVRQYLLGGHQVFGTCRKPDDATALKKLLEEYPEKLTLFPFEVTDLHQIKTVQSKISRSVDGIDILINNAGIFPPNEIESVSVDQMVEAFQVNTVAPFMITRCFRSLLKRGNSAIVVNISSLLGSISSGAGLGDWADYAYGPSKAALNRAVRQMALDLKDDGITVIAQNPGWVKTDMGGQDAPLSTSESVTTMRELIERLSLEDSGRVLEPNGSDAPW